MAYSKDFRTAQSSFLPLPPCISRLASKIQLVGLRRTVSSPVGFWNIALAKIELVHFSRKIWHQDFNDLPFSDCTILHLGLRILLPGLDKIGWTAWLQYALLFSPIVFKMTNCVSGGTFNPTQYSVQFCPRLPEIARTAHSVSLPTFLRRIESYRRSVTRLGVNQCCGHCRHNIDIRVVAEEGARSRQPGSRRRSVPVGWPGPPSAASAAADTDARSPGGQLAGARGASDGNWTVSWQLADCRWLFRRIRFVECMVYAESATRGTRLQLQYVRPCFEFFSVQTESASFRKERKK